MEALLKRELGTSLLKSTGHSGGGCISEGQSFDTDTGRVFVKINHKNEARRMFDGEMASLEAILGTDTVKVPRPVKVVDLESSGALFVMEHIDMRSLNKYDSKSREPVIIGVNDWQDDWVSFYAQQRLQHQLSLVEQSYGDREARELWARLQLKVPQLFADTEVVPALLHGDLWGGNVAECSDGPVIFDPASYYGHSEFELAIAGMFGGFGGSFYSAYHEKIPKAAGFAKRQQLYQLFHYLNHWNHFGGGYRGSSVRIMKDLAK
ncbi:ketosamine-3-kinase isoform X2 [Puntigrus tetrazona]|uniref:ketosamine-3-kinase isoform X2 n=1 Tax=Puntigrus tetrazona TaxID=1606681 RepID=UPI001C89CA92|nr:ketosamine-3-kinase isoform X2 [Puntigrus tetrazona]